MAITRMSFTVQDGPIIRLRVALPRAIILARQQAGFVTAAPVEVDALIDTGAEATCVDNPIITQLGLPATTGTLANVPSLGGITGSVMYSAGLTLLQHTNKRTQHLDISAIPVLGLNLSTFGVKAVLGRDVLAYCVLIYDGLTGTFTLSY